MTNILSLPKTKLILADGTLRKRGSGDEVIATFELADVKDIYCENTVDVAFPAVMSLVLAALAMIAKLYITSEGWGWTVCILCSGLAVLSLLMISGKKIFVETEDGTVGYAVQDSFDDADGFVISVKQHLKKARETAGD